MMKAAFFGDTNSAIEIEFMDENARNSILDRVYPPDRKKVIARCATLYPSVITASNFKEHVHQLQDLDCIFATWGMPDLSAEQLAALPNLKAIFYAAGSVQRFARPILQSGIKLINAAAANAIPVAEFTVAQVLLANKGYFRNIRDYSSPQTIRTAFRGTGNYHTTVSLLGAGIIGRKVIELLRPFQLHLLVFDPFLSPEAAHDLGVEKVDLETAFSRAMVVSNHLANNEATRKMLNRPLFAAMPQDAVFINTGRGATVNEADLLDVFEQRPDLTALLDVADPEPPADDSPLFSRPNIILSTHIAGSMNEEIPRMADLVIDEFKNWISGQPLNYEVTLDMLETMA